MTRRTALLAVVLFALAGGLAWAHEGHTHTVMGTVTAHTGAQLEVKTTEGKTVTIAVNDKTTVVRGTAKLTMTDLSVGQRVVVDVGSGSLPLTARQIKVGGAKK